MPLTDQVDLNLARDIILEPGQISLHDVYLVHGYFNRALFLLHGEDKSGCNDFSRGHES